MSEKSFETEGEQGSSDVLAGMTGSREPLSPDEPAVDTFGSGSEDGPGGAGDIGDLAAQSDEPG